MGNNRANIVTIRVTSDHIVKSDIAAETIYCAAGGSSKTNQGSQRSSTPKPWSLQVPSSDTLENKLQRRPRSSSSHRQRRLSNESCKTTVSDSVLHVASRHSSRSRSGNRSPRLNHSSGTFGSNLSVTSMGDTEEIKAESFYLRVPRRPKSCNPSRRENDSHMGEQRNFSLQKEVAAVRPKSWCSMRETTESVEIVEEASKSYSEQNVKADGVLDGKTISHFYKVWNISSKDKMLGRGKLDLPNSLKRLEKYRPCGCPTRHQVGECKNDVTSSP